MRPQQRPMSPGMKQGLPHASSMDGPLHPSSPMNNRTMTPNGQGPPKSMSPNGQGPPRGPGMMQGPPKSMPPNGQGPPRGPGMTQGPPRSMSPAGNRPMVPPNHPSQQRPIIPQGPSPPRPTTPQGQTTQKQLITPPGQSGQEVSPSSEGRARSDSDTDPISKQPSSINPSTPTDGPLSPPKIRSPVERKPVPGQAL